ncbi:MAG: DUF4250 domain-containing protein [Clostridium sp.]|nr:DUF4250 domain-containing protein [Clostridium sp.]MBO6150408.1 DUF4250 domain-containing protein [Clostridium sp.]
MSLPKDPVICLSVVNTLLRDTGDTLDEVCRSRGEEKEDLLRRMAEAGFEYDEEERRFR